ncbi:hypothetical protein FRC04_004337 [Tulasnella sp. 424]|nr:hypothetical protein FRC04_004337 [Tulasnella sp. 424]KAG8979453.1 hypothetical protein FRC05_008439 [Tulasnella sp. 425]
MPSNDTTLLPTTDDADSSLLLRWTDQGNYGEGISRVLENENGSNGIEKGALVHFWENITWSSWNLTTTTPWIAFINCDKNSSDMSEMDDIFSEVRDRGAAAALMYSTTSQTCKLNNEYFDPTEFDKVLDIYTTITRSSARLIESQFQNINKSEYYAFDALRLNNTAQVVLNAINGTGVEPGYLIATVKLANVTDPDTGLGPNSNPTSSGTNNQGKGSNTGLAMIILYAITGCVSALFCIVIITGAVRAVRNPERYGPRVGQPGMDGWEGEPQTRAAGLTRAILDTFPIVKFGRGGTTAPAPALDPQASVYTKTQVDSDIESGSILPKPKGGLEEYEMGSSVRNMNESREMGSVDTAVGGIARHASGSIGSRRSRPSKEDPTREMIGTEICPICISEFEEGDDLRVLPCEGKHKFHQNCVDPWLLQISGLCPLCREDFTALENMATGVAPEEAEAAASPPQNLQTPQQSASGVSRFSKYLRSAQRHHHHPVPQEPSSSSDGHP